MCMCMCVWGGGGAGMCVAYFASIQTFFQIKTALNLDVVSPKLRLLLPKPNLISPKLKAFSPR